MAAIDHVGAMNAARLVAQADALEARAAALRTEASELSRAAIDLRVEADRLTREPLRFLPSTRARRPVEDTLFLDRVLDVLDGAGPLAVSDVADHLNASVPRVRQALERLMETGVVTRSGLKRGTRYTLADDADAPEGVSDNVREFQSYETMVRDAAVKLQTFGFVDIQRELPDVSDGTLRRWLGQLEERGIIASERVGPAKVYAYTPPESKSAPRPRQRTPEQEVAKVGRLRGDAVAGTGRAELSGSSIVNALIREVRSHGITTKRTGHKVVFMRDGQEIAHASSTPGASSLKQTRSALRKAGVPVA